MARGCCPRTPFVPPRTLITFFAIVVAYVAYRLLFLEHPTYVEAKFSEGPETCFAGALCFRCADIGLGISRGIRRRAG